MRSRAVLPGDGKLACRAFFLHPRGRTREERTVKITLLSDEAVRLESTGGEMTIEALTPEQQYSPFHMLASGLAYCTWSVLASWGSHVDIHPDDLVIDVRWTFADKPHRVGTIDLSFEWPSLPANRREVAKRAAELCAIHATLTHSPAITITQSDGRNDATASTPAAAGSSAR